MNTTRNFGTALTALKNGYKLAREGWNGKGMYVKLVNDYNLSDTITHTESENTVYAGLLPWIGMKTADNMFVPWLASQTDILAEDWTVVE